MPDIQRPLPSRTGKPDVVAVNEDGGVNEDGAGHTRRRVSASGRPAKLIVRGFIAGQRFIATSSSSSWRGLPSISSAGHRDAAVVFRGTDPQPLGDALRQCDGDVFHATKIVEHVDRVN